MKRFEKIVLLRVLPAVEEEEAREVTSCCAQSVAPPVSMLLPSSQVPGINVFLCCYGWILWRQHFCLKVHSTSNQFKGNICRFVKCESCSHFFVVLSEADQRVKVKDVKQAEQVLLQAG